MTFYHFEISDFQAQLDNALNNAQYADAKVTNLVKTFTALPNANVEDFNKLVAAVQHVDYSSARGKFATAPVVNLLVSQQAHLENQDIMNKLNDMAQNQNMAPVSANNNIPVQTSDMVVMQCVNKGTLINKQFELKELAGPVANYQDYLDAKSACKDFALTKIDHFLTLTGDTSGCKGPYDAVNAYFICMSDF